MIPEGSRDGVRHCMTLHVESTRLFSAHHRLCLQHLCLPFRPLPYLTWPITCGNSTGLNDPTSPRLPPTLLPFQKQSPALHVESPRLFSARCFAQRLRIQHCLPDCATLAATLRAEESACAMFRIVKGEGERSDSDTVQAPGSSIRWNAVR